MGSVAALFALTLGAGAALMFSIQPAVARMALPILGGTPSVWNTCMVFFQASVLAGYGLAHLLATRLCPRPQAGLFLLLILAGGLGLPIAMAQTADQSPASPVVWLLGRLTISAGLPALALATASPLLQNWFNLTRGGSEGEPYFLYAASNIGSLGALLAYPALVERLWPLDAQTRIWAGGYVVWALAIVACAAVMFRAMRARPDPAPPINASESTQSPRQASPPRWQRLAWVALGAIPASLLQGCTLFLTTDVAAIPLLWVVPLALFLLTFVVAFSTRGLPIVRGAARVLPFLAAALLFIILGRFTQPVGWLIVVHLAFLAAAGLVCHGRLVALRPEPARLTEFYFAMSIGGVLGGAFNSLVAPHLFRSVAEYPMAIALACAALPPRARRRSTQRHAMVLDAAAATLAGGLLVVLGLVVPWLIGDAGRLREAVVFGIPAIACCSMLDRPPRLAIALAVSFGCGLWIQNLWTGTRKAERNFFGITRVTEESTGRFNQLVHGNTIHGRQFRDPAHRGEPLTYYHREGPLGLVFDALEARRAGPDPAPRHVGVIGLGIGSSAAYAQPGEEWTFFEIDPAIIRVAQDPRWFSFLADCRAGQWRIVEGDARLRLAGEPDTAFDLLLLDAFSSDAIPVHLLTREALALYLRKLKPGGLIAAHISNRYLNLEPVFAALAADAGIACRSGDDSMDSPSAGKEASHWMVLARHESDLGKIRRQSLWTPAKNPESVALWTDQRAGVFDVFEWK